VIRLVAFDLDGTLVRGDTVIEHLAKALGHWERARELEAFHDARRDRDSLKILREEIAACYRGASISEIVGHLASIALAPGVRAGFARLRSAGIETAIVTFTWEFAAEWLARELGADHWLGTRLRADGTIDHVWPEDKAAWLGDLIARRGLPRDDVAAVGDSWRDLPMFEIAGRSYYVGEVPPPDVDVIHVPDGDIDEIARHIVEHRDAATLRLTSYSGAHAAAVVDVISSVFIEYGMTFDLPAFDADLQDIEHHYVAGGGMFAVLVDGDRVVGTVAVMPRERGECELKRLYLRSELRGRRQGRRLLEHAIAWARARGYRRMIAWSDVRFDTAHQLYRRAGFSVFGERTVDDIDRSREYGFAIDLVD
jgi:HAD superfamily phosphoserine phosphatase-like hydrolase